jgi:D-amino-acid dehydrogenase
MRIIVIGGGILGASTAFHLARTGVEVTIFDRRDAGRATSAGAGIICPWVSAIEDPAYRVISCSAARYYPQLVAALNADGQHPLGYKKVGSLAAPADPAALDAVEEKLALQKANWPELGETRRLTPAQAQALFPPLAPGRAAIHIPGAARVDGRLMNAALLAAAQRHGAVVREDAAEIVTTNGHVTGVKTDAGTLEADAVIVTGGAWAPHLAPFGGHLNIQPQRGQIVHLRVRADTSGWPVLQPLASYYLLAFDDRRVVIGATRETGAGFDYRVTAAGQHEVLGVALSEAPGLADAELIETRVGFRPMSPDHLPFLGPWRGVDGLWVGNGLGPSGLTIGPYAGALLAAAASGGNPELDLAPYAPQRP